MKTLKSGDDVTYQIGGRSLVLTPMPWGRLKKVFKIVSELAQGFSGNLTNEPSKFMNWITTLLENNSDEFILLLFDKEKNEFLNMAWVDENITLANLQQIVTDAITINGVMDFLGKKGPANQVIDPTGTVPGKKKEMAPA